jgi:hypothetical protein
MTDGVAKAAARIGVGAAEKLVRSADGLVSAASGEVPSSGTARSEAPRRRRSDDDRQRATEREYLDRELEDEWDLGR